MRLGMTPMIIGGMLIVSLLAMGLTVFINLHKFDAAFDDAVNDRFYFLLEEARDSIEGEMRLGQTLEKLTNAKEAISALKRVDPYILSVEVFNKEGRTLYSTDNSFLFDITPHSWVESWQISGRGRWELIEKEVVILGLGLQDMLSQPAGSLVVLYSTSLQEDTFAKVKQKLIVAAFWIWGIAVLLMLGIVLYLTRPLKKYFQKLEIAIDDLPGKADLQSEKQDAHVLGFMAGYQAAELELQKLEEALLEMDEGKSK